MAYDFDLFVIGAGSGGVRAARIAAAHGARVAVAERKYLGGTCVNVGCVPKKLMVFAASYADHFADAEGFGWAVGERRHNWRAFIEHKDREIARLNSTYERLLEGPGAEIIWGDARITGAHEVTVGERTVTAERILIATGGRPVLPDLPGAPEHGLTSDDVFYLDEMPRRILIVGAGYIGLEFAGIFRRLGAEVTLVHRRGLILNDGFDIDIRHALQEELQAQGVDLSFDCVIERIEKVEGGLRVHRSNCAPIEVDQVLFATGRSPNVDGLGLDAVGVELDPRQAIRVDEIGRTSVPSIYAIGDVTDRIQLTPVALAEGHALADRFYGPGKRQVSYENIPTAVFSNPPLAQVGLTEDAAHQAFGDDVDVYEGRFRAMRFAFAGRNARTVMKLVVQRSTDRVVGLHMMGEDAPEIVQGFAVAVKMGGTKADFDATVGIHPTMAEELVTMRTKRETPLAQVAAN